MYNLLSGVQPLEISSLQLLVCGHSVTVGSAAELLVTAVPDKDSLSEGAQYTASWDASCVHSMHTKDGTPLCLYRVA